MTQTAGGANGNDRSAEAEFPDCFGFKDTRDPSCRRCKVKDACEVRQLEIRPECFGVEWSEKDVECQACLVASQCADAMEDDTMARRKVRMRKPASKVVEKPEPEPEEEVVEAVADESDYTEMSVADLRAECEDRELDATGRKSVLVRRLLVDDGEEVEEAAEPEPPKREIKRRVAEKAAPKPKPEPEPEQDVEGADFSFDALLDALDDGKTLVVKVTDDGYQVSMSDAAVTTATAAPQPQTKGLRGEDFWREVLTDDYYAFTREDAGGGKAWDDMTREEKVEFADDLGVSWDESEDEKVDFMAMVRAVMKHLEIVKYKPEYKSSAARKALR